MEEIQIACVPDIGPLKTAWADVRWLARTPRARRIIAMARRKKTGTFDDLVELVSMLP